ncbi:EscF/YscF/HrpA family type III secretion system needle major subunit [Roseomonas marmotae]|uniref:Type III secretion protein n=1 Tax=Roseomonas marmotae TaxID=2768161 RepID=A0ABS3KJM7_9PROT|nr:EscF/YscF/HrpA family type III secretion system needle major subunit [Roseomonas marmotae]MBO1076536.1 hypothetical protein [Roseomonas marmotae]QTI81848.1 hypothetical protein IAI58_21105 [Roseomonas marmotae]
MGRELLNGLRLLAHRSFGVLAAPAKAKADRKMIMNDAPTALVPLDDASLDQVIGGVGIPGGSPTFEAITLSLGQVTAGREDALHASVPTIAPEPTADMLAMQQQMQQWSMMTQIQSTIVKGLSDAMKGVVQKAT